MIKQTLTALAFLLTPIAAAAGSACPVALTIHDLGVPSWLDRDALLTNNGTAWLGYRFETKSNGELVTFVHSDSPMERAGIVVGNVLRSVNGIAAADRDAYRAVFDSMRVGDTLSVTVSDGRSTRTLSVTVGATDPIPLGMVNALKHGDCTNGELHNATDAEKSQVQPYLYDENRTFRCHDAHIAMQELADPYAMNDVYILRGSRRAIIAMPHWGAACVELKDISGSNLTDTNLLSVIAPVIANYVAVAQNDI